MFPSYFSPIKLYSWSCYFSNPFEIISLIYRCCRILLDHSMDFSNFLIGESFQINLSSQCCLGTGMNVAWSAISSTTTCIKSCWLHVPSAWTCCSRNYCQEWVFNKQSNILLTKNCNLFESKIMDTKKASANGCLKSSFNKIIYIYFWSIPGNLMIQW